MHLDSADGSHSCREAGAPHGSQNHEASGLFIEHGYAGTSLDEVVAAARVTKGALYHHFPSKLALFESVFLDVQEATSREVSQALSSSRDPWERAQIGLE